MIKSLFDESEDKEPNASQEIRQTETQFENMTSSDDNNLLEIPLFDNFEEINPAADQPDFKSGGEIKTEIPQNSDEEFPATNFIFSNPAEPTTVAEALEKAPDDYGLFQMQRKPESTSETARKSGLAMSAAITLFGSVVFLLIIGWFADLLLGTSPWGIVAGIVLGSAIGFFQFFRMTSQILKNND